MSVTMDTVRIGNRIDELLQTEKTTTNFSLTVLETSQFTRANTKSA
jgi:hypothetical protein